MKSLVPTEALLSLLQGDTQSNGGEFTALSKKTGKDYTYKVSRKKFNERWYTHIKVEVGYLDWLYLGFFKEGKVVRKGQEIETPSAKGIAWILNNIQIGNYQAVESQVEVMHLGKCLRCGRPLTDSDSITIGFGPVCRAK
jgi:hypothetical protein